MEQLQADGIHDKFRLRGRLFHAFLIMNTRGSLKQRAVSLKRFRARSTDLKRIQESNLAERRRSLCHRQTC